MKINTLGYVVLAVWLVSILVGVIPFWNYGAMVLLAFAGALMAKGANETKDPFDEGFNGIFLIAFAAVTIIIMFVFYFWAVGLLFNCPFYCL